MLKRLIKHAQSQDGQEGFTLVEIMVVMAIIGMLAAMVVINVLPAQDKATRQVAARDVATIEQALELYRLENRRYPTTVEGLAALVSGGNGYLKKLPQDPWGNAYQYASPGQYGKVDVYSLGADGREGGEDDDADIGNWQ